MPKFSRPPEPSAAPAGAQHRAGSRRPARALRILAGFFVALACLFAFPTLAEAQAPTVIATGRVSADGTYNLGDTISLSVTFSAAVTVTGTPQLALVIGTDTTPRANYASGSGTQTLQFDYEVAAGDEDTDGIAFPINGLALNGGTIRRRRHRRRFGPWSYELYWAAGGRQPPRRCASS